MKKLLFTILLLASTAALTGCGALKRTPEQVAADSAAHVKGTELLQSRVWMVQADRIHFGSGKDLYCTPNTNFVILNGNRAIVQVAPAMGGGPNGVGGMTLNGDISNYKATFNPNGSAYITFNISSLGRQADVAISYAKGFNNCTIRVQPSFRPWNVTITGAVSDYDPSLIIEGSNRG